MEGGGGGATATAAAAAAAPRLVSAPSPRQGGAPRPEPCGVLALEAGSGRVLGWAPGRARPRRCCAGGEAGRARLAAALAVLQAGVGRGAAASARVGLHDVRVAASCGIAVAVLSPAPRAGGDGGDGCRGAVAAALVREALCRTHAGETRAAVAAARAEAEQEEALDTARRQAEHPRRGRGRRRPPLPGYESTVRAVAGRVLRLLGRWLRPLAALEGVAGCWVLARGRRGWARVERLDASPGLRAGTDSVPWFAASGGPGGATLGDALWREAERTADRARDGADGEECPLLCPAVSDELGGPGGLRAVAQALPPAAGSLCVLLLCRGAAALSAAAAPRPRVPLRGPDAGARAASALHGRLAAAVWNAWNACAGAAPAKALADDKAPPPPGLVPGGGGGTVTTPLPALRMVPRPPPGNSAAAAAAAEANPGGTGSGRSRTRVFTEIAAQW